MRPALASLLTAAALSLAAAPAAAAVISTVLPVPLTTPDNPAGGGFDGTGVWFNPLTGYAEERGSAFPDPLFEDGKFFLLRNTAFAQPAAQIFVQGFFARGNGVIYASDTNPNPARFGENELIGPGVGWQVPGGGFPDLGPVFGNWADGGRGFLGLMLRDPAGTGPQDVFYGFADITVNPDFSITLHGFAFENVRGAPILTAFTPPIPEPSALLLMALGLGGLALRLRRG
jgi:hypothetical protein